MLSNFLKKRMLPLLLAISIIVVGCTQNKTEEMKLDPNDITSIPMGTSMEKVIETFGNPKEIVESSEEGIGTRIFYDTVAYDLDCELMLEFNAKEYYDGLSWKLYTFNMSGLITNEKIDLFYDMVEKLDLNVTSDNYSSEDSPLSYIAEGDTYDCEISLVMRGIAPDITFTFSVIPFDAKYPPI